jgi:hypothetical protein
MIALLRQCVALYQILGGGGALVWFVAELSQQEVKGYGLAYAIGLTAPCLAACILGVFLIRHSPFARWASVVLQLVLVPKVFTPTVTFGITLGPDAVVLVFGRPTGAWGARFFATPFPNAAIFFNDPAQPLGFGISMVSVVAIVVLLWPVRRPVVGEQPVSTPPDNPLDAFRASSGSVRQAKTQE